MSGGWISVKDRLPATDTAVLVVVSDSGQFVTIATRFATSSGEWEEIDGRVWKDGAPDAVTHWQPLPEPPK